MAQKKEQYVIRGGKAGYERLLLLARNRWPDTFALFQRAGLGPGMRCLDLGCGGGEVSFEIARMVSPGGTVTGVDMDEVKLDLAHQTAAERRIENAGFRRMNVNDWSEPGAYDMVYSRLLLQHLSEPIDLLRRMWDGVRPGGILVVEDADFDGCFCDPANDGFDFYVRTYCEVLRRHGGDPARGRKLFRHFQQAGIPEPHLALVQSMHSEGEGKRLPWSTLEASSETIVSSNVASRTDISAALTSLAKFTADPLTLISGPRIFQLWSRRKLPGDLES